MKRLLNAHDISWQERAASLAKLGYPTHQSYIDGVIWFRIREKLRTHPYFTRCTVCAALGKDRPAEQLHHKHYRNLEAIEEWPDYIVPLCQPHHKQLHDLAKECSLAVEDASNIVLRSAGARLCCPDAGKNIDEWELEDLKASLEREARPDEISFPL